MYDFPRPPVEHKAALANISAGWAGNYLAKTFKPLFLPEGMFVNDHLIARLLGTEVM